MVPPTALLPAKLPQRYLALLGPRALQTKGIYIHVSAFSRYFLVAFLAPAKFPTHDMKKKPNLLGSQGVHTSSHQVFILLR